MDDLSTLLGRLRAWYRSDQDDIVEEFYLPCLAAADSYDRAAGFFSSRLLPFLVRGLWKLIERDGRMRLVCSPRLSQADAEAIAQGYKRRTEAVSDALRSEIGRAALESLESVELLAWMVGEGILDIKIAVPERWGGLYHEKFGLFSRGGRDFAAFTGSPNETEDGILWNFEHIAVFVVSKHEEREAKRVADLRIAFSSLWENETAGLDVMPFPDAARRDLLRYRPPLAPRPTPVGVALRAELFPHQEDAISAWRAAGYRGILEMATGTGKTLTALAAVLPFAQRRHIVIVLVPGVELLRQWADVIRTKVSGAAVLTCGGGDDWAAPLSRFLQRWRLLTAKPTIESKHRAHFVVVTMDTAASERFRSRFMGLGGRSVLIIDEVHRVGSRYRRSSLGLGAEKRLGLSATPDRPWDEGGWRAILRGVGPVIFRFPLEEAVGRYLTPYEYRPRLVSLTVDERDEYRALSDEIRDTFRVLTSKYPATSGDLRALLEIATPDEARSLQQLLYRRADVLKEARMKLRLVDEIACQDSVRRCLIYCNDEEQVGHVVLVLSRRARSFAVFTSARLGKFDRKTVLRDFEEGIVDFLVAIRCLDEGVDIPGATHALILASSRSEREFVQRRGRILRRSPGKDFSVIHDPVVIPFTVDEDGRAMSRIEAFELGIITGELHRAELFARAASNAVEALAFLHKIRSLVKEASDAS